VRPLVVVLGLEAGEAGRLLGEVPRRRFHRRLERQVEAFVPTVLLRPARLDPFVADAELGPPDAEGTVRDFVRGAACWERR
jgi:hypothetical protein